jgi:glycosyl transferase family 25
MLLNNIWVINLDNSKDRLENIKNNFRSLGIKFNRFSAVYGKTLPIDVLEEKTNDLCRNFLCTFGIIGCALSHKYLWQQLVNDSMTDKYLILEDDVVLTETSVDIIRKLEEKINKYKIDYLNLYCANIGCQLKSVEFEIDGCKFGKPYFPLTTSGYIITKEGARKLLENISKVTYHIDFEIAMNMLKSNINIYSSSPTVINTTDDDTTIGMSNKSITLHLLNSTNMSYYMWFLTIPVFTIRMYYIINIWLLLLILLLVFNKYKLNSDILFWFIIIELFLFHIVYLL